LADARPKIAKLKIAVAAPADVQMTVKVDGETIPLANLNTNRPMDPGEHTIEATANGYKKATAKVTLQEAGSDTVALTLEVDPNAPKPEVVTAGPPVGSNAPSNQPTIDRRADERSSRLPAYVALGVGGLGVGVGTVFGVLALGKKGTLDDRCGAAKQCGPDQQTNIDAGKTLGTVSTIGFVVGAVGLAVGAYLYLTSGPSTGSSHAAATTRKIPQAFTPYVSVDHAGLIF
jgi:hypothetical protein